ncbi:MAG: adenylyl-sulfate kinase [Flavonifractor plautii]
MPYQLSEINEKIRRDPAAFLAECDAHYQERIHAAVDKILARMKESPIVLLSGPSGSGKTTTAMKVERELERRGVNAHTVSMDNYFKTLNRRTAPRTPEGDIDYESPKLLDMELLDETFDRLVPGRRSSSPTSSSPARCATTAGAPPAAGEGRDCHLRGHSRPQRRHCRPPPGGHGHVYLRPLQHPGGGAAALQGHLDAHLSPRRAGLQFPRDRPVGNAADGYNVRRGEKKYISPYKGRAHVIIDSSLR